MQYCLQNEYVDPPEVLKEKVKLLGNLLKNVNLCCAYTGTFNLVLLLFIYFISRQF